MKLTIELVPKTSWYSNVRSNVSKEEWDIIRKKCYKQADYKCEICGGKGEKHPVECHEIWEYDDINHVQKLTNLIALCPNCHKTKHIGLARIKGEEELVIEHIMKVNDINKKEALKYINKCFDIWQKRSNFNWKLDISSLKNF